MTATAVRPVAIKTDEATKARVKRLADARHRTSQWLMRKVITQYVDREEKREAWEEYRTTGLRVTADEAKLAVKAIRQGVKVLGQQPGVGRPIEDMPDEFRDSGYVARYRIDSDAVTILAVRHQKEVGY